MSKARSIFRIIRNAPPTSLQFKMPNSRIGTLKPYLSRLPKMNDDPHWLPESAHSVNGDFTFIKRKYFENNMDSSSHLDSDAPINNPNITQCSAPNPAHDYKVIVDEAWKYNPDNLRLRCTYFQDNNIEDTIRSTTQYGFEVSIVSEKNDKDKEDDDDDDGDFWWYCQVFSCCVNLVLISYLY